jgi:hypothetical protein
MRKSLFILAQFLIIIFLLNQSIFAQEKNVNDKLQEFRDQKMEIKNLTRLTETVLDSIIHYSYESENDSVRLLKKAYEIDGSGEFETRYEYVWLNDQWVNSSKTELTFNEFEQLVLLEAFNWDQEQSVWINYRHITITYDEYGYDDLYTFLRWNENLDRWDSIYKENSDFDENRNLLQYVEWQGNDLNEWEYYYKEVNTYNDDNSLNDSYIAFWNTDIEEWENYHREEFYYHESGLTNYRLYYLWMNGEWTLSLKTDYYYGETELLDSLTTFQREMEEWILFSQRNFSYDENENPVLVKDVRWIDEMWENYQQYESEYDQSNYRTSYISSIWDGISSTWIYQYKLEDLYDESGNRLMASSYNWSLNEMQWIGIDMSENYFDEDNNLLMAAFFDWDDNLSDWVIKEKAFYYRSIISQIPEHASDSIHIYPNPVENVLTIETNNEYHFNCTILSLTGQKLAQMKVSHSKNQINMAKYPAGIYFLQLKDGNKIISKKIIKK